MTGIASPTIPFTAFDTKNTQLGRGVWNLKTSPVVYMTNYKMYLRIYDFWYNYNKKMVTEGNKSQYFPRAGQFYFFDPSSIEVELNPDVFPASEVEWTQVEGICLSRAENGITGTDNYREAFGMSPRYIDIGGRSRFTDFDDSASLLDFFYYDSNKHDYTYPAVVCTPIYEYGYGSVDFPHYDAVVGRGKAGSLSIEPIALWEDGNRAISSRIPALEVMVTMMVKVRSLKNPLVFVRHYLPEVKQLNVYPDHWKNETEADALSKINNVWQNIKARQPKGTGINRQSPTYDYEMKRIGKILNFFNSDFKAN